MENSYGIGTANRYALFLDDESDPLETLKLKEQEKEQKKKNKVAEKENKGKVEAPAKTKQTVIQKKPPREQTKPQDSNREGFEGKQNHQRSNVDGKPERNFNKSTENREERNNRRNREDRQFNGGFENNRDREDRPQRREGDNFENRRGGRAGANKTGGRGGGRGRVHDDRRGKREFDRQSGSDKTHGFRGIKPVEKREGGGAFNWGTATDGIEDDKTNEADQTWGDVEKQETTPTTTETPPKTTDTEAETAPTEEEPKVLTLDEYKAQLAVRSKPQYNIRKAGEGEDLSQWKQMYELNKKKGREDEETDDDEYDTPEYPQRVGRQKHVHDIDFHFNESRQRIGGRGRGGRGTRGGTRGASRGDRQGSRFRGNDEHADDRTDARHTPKFDDEHDFPSLGVKVA